MFNNLKQKEHHIFISLTFGLFVCFTDSLEMLDRTEGMTWLLLSLSSNDSVFYITN